MRSRQVAFRMQSALTRLEEPMPAPATFKKVHCPDAAIRSQTAGAEPLLSLSFADSRYEARSPLPLSLTAPLESDEAAQVSRFFEARANAGSFMTSLLRSEAHAVAAQRAVEHLEQRQYKGVFHILRFVKAQLIRKKNKLRREWTRGGLEAWLVVYDLDSSESLCSTRLFTMNEVDAEPISLRLRPDTEQKLVRALGEQMRAESAKALSTISDVLRIPDAKVAPRDLALPNPSAASVAALDRDE
jgi:hypothetical protein